MRQCDRVTTTDLKLVLLEKMNTVLFTKQLLLLIPRVNDLKKKTISSTCVPDTNDSSKNVVTILLTQVKWEF